MTLQREIAEQLDRAARAQLAAAGGYRTVERRETELQRRLRNQLGSAWPATMPRQLDLARQRSATVRSQRKVARLEAELKETRRELKRTNRKVAALEKRIDGLLGVGDRRVARG